MAKHEPEPASSQPPATVDELLPQANPWQTSLSERVRGLGGLPAHLRRLGEIEHLTAQATILARKIRSGTANVHQLDELVAHANALIDNHNRYFPIEANLPIDRATGLPLHGEGVFCPRAHLHRDALLRAAT